LERLSDREKNDNNTLTILIAGIVATTMIAITAAVAHAQITRMLDPGMQLHRIVMVT
jgi:hypothetical protein